MSYPPYGGAPGGYPPAGGYPAGQPGGYPQGGGFSGPGYPAPGGQVSQMTQNESQIYCHHNPKTPSETQSNIKEQTMMRSFDILAGAIHLAL